MFERRGSTNGRGTLPADAARPVEGRLTEAQLATLGAGPLSSADPERVGPYELLGLLGVGGMGQVYLGLAGDRLAAVKVIRADFAHDPEFRRRFARELAAVRRVGPAHTAPLIEARTEGAVPWLATEYVAGIALTEAVSPEAPLPAEAVWQLAAGVGRALAAIHQSGLVHRDLKPANVILTLDGPKVIDFGVAHTVDLSALTMTGQQIGTPSYMAPEQATTGAVAAASDVFAFGCLLAFAATGTPPFGVGAANEVTYRVVHQEPDLAALTALDPELAALVGRCLVKDPAGRPDADALVAAATAANPSAAWPEAIGSRIAARAAVIGAVGAESATLPTSGVRSSGETAIVAPGGLPRSPADVVQARKRRRGLVIGSVAVAAVLIATGAGIFFSSSGNAATKNRQPSLGLAATGRANLGGLLGTSGASPGQTGPNSTPSGSAAARPGASTSAGSTGAPGAPGSPGSSTTTGAGPAQTPPPQAAQIAYVGRVASSAAAQDSTSLTLHPGNVSAGDTLIVSVMLTNVDSGSVGVSDSQGNAYSDVYSVTDGAAKDRTLLFVATGVRALSGGSITLTYPSNTEHHVAVDAFSGLVSVDQHSAASGSAASFDSGTVQTGSAEELVFATAGIQGGSATGWTDGLNPLPTLFVSEDQLATAYRIVSAGGSYDARGSAEKTWMAGIVTVR